MQKNKKQKQSACYSDASAPEKKNNKKKIKPLSEFPTIALRGRRVLVPAALLGGQSGQSVIGRVRAGSQRRIGFRER